jgi:DNA invertase Pin-like site-specific DNA recombinase
MRAAIYARVSTGKQAEKDLSIPDQIAQMQAWCERNNYDVGEIYVEGGKTGTVATKRPVFKKLMKDACVTPAPYDLILVHSFSRFYRNLIEMGLIHRVLKEHDARLVSITQEVADDATGEMMRNLISMFDEYSSKENGKHTLRAMQENARRGNFCGSRVPYGYMAQETEEKGNKGKKKKLVVNPEEAEVVRKIFNLYVVRNLGFKGVANALNEQNILRRGKSWNTSSIKDLLANRTYLGEYYFNCTCSKTGKAKPMEDWIPIPIEPIITEETFALAKAKREQRSPKVMHPRQVSSPRLLTGLLHCGECGSTMTTATGKGNQYHYYKCTSKINHHIGRCSSKALSMEKVDNVILETLADMVFTPERVSLMLAELKQRFQGKSNLDSPQQLSEQLELTQTKIHRMYDAIENGIVTMDETFKDRLANLKRQKEQLTAKIHYAQNSSLAQLDSIDSADVRRFCGLMKKRLLDKSAGYSKDYVKFLIKDIVVNNEDVEFCGDYGSLLGAVKFAQKNETEHLLQSTRFRVVWLPVADKSGQWKESLRL